MCLGELGNPVNPFAGMKLISHNTTDCSFCGSTYTYKMVYKDSDGDEHEHHRDCPRCWRQFHSDEEVA